MSGPDPECPNKSKDCSFFLVYSGFYFSLMIIDDDDDIGNKHNPTIELREWGKGQKTTYRVTLVSLLFLSFFSFSSNFNTHLS